MYRLRASSPSTTFPSHDVPVPARPPVLRPPGSSAGRRTARFFDVPVEFVFSADPNPFPRVHDSASSSAVEPTINRRQRRGRNRGELRFEASAQPDDPELHALVGEVSNKSPESGAGRADLLLEPWANIGSVAEQVGYGSPFALSSAFKRVRGDQPAAAPRRRACARAADVQRRPAGFPYRDYVAEPRCPG